MSTEKPKSEELDSMTANNVWHHKKELAPLIDQVLRLTEEGNDWTWVMNSCCKYIQINIDMRDGHFTLMDRERNRINLDQLKWQYSDTGSQPAEKK